MKVILVLSVIFCLLSGCVKSASEEQKSQDSEIFHSCAKQAIESNFGKIKEELKDIKTIKKDWLGSGPAYDLSIIRTAVQCDGNDMNVSYSKFVQEENISRFYTENKFFVFCKGEKVIAFQTGLGEEDGGHSAYKAKYGQPKPLCNFKQQWRDGSFMKHTLYKNGVADGKFAFTHGYRYSHQDVEFFWAIYIAPSYHEALKADLSQVVKAATSKIK